MKPLVSIIIPVYNGANYLKEAIESALAQTYENIEIIVVNDGSADQGETEKIALSYGDKIRYIPKENGGSSSALNRGIREMRGEFFSWLSHDDLYLPQKVERSLAAWNGLKDDNAVVVCEGMLINGQGEPLVSKKRDLTGKKSAEEAFFLLTHGKGINGCAILIPKAILDRVGFFDEQMVYLNDLDYWYRLILSKVNVFYLNEKLVKCRIHGQQVSVRKIHLFDAERHYLAQKTLKNADKICIDRSCALKNIAYFCASENLKTELAAAKKLLEENKNLNLRVSAHLACTWVIGAIKRFLKYLRKKILFRR